MAMLRRLIGSGLVGMALVSFAACSSSESKGGEGHLDAGDAGPELPPRICRMPAAADELWFEDVTDQVGLGKTESLTPVGSCMVSADFDADGSPDLVSMSGNSMREVVATNRFLFRGRPSASDSKQLVFENVPDQAGLLATRDGTQDRGASIALIGDLNNDGSVDLITCVSDFTNNKNPDNTSRTVWDPCTAFLNDGKGHFTQAPQSDLDIVVPAPSAVLLDYDRDGVLDFWPAGIAHWPYMGQSSSNDGPRVFRGNGDGTFTETTIEAGLPIDDTNDPNSGFRPNLGVTSCDLDDDGDQDVLLSTYGRRPNLAFRNDNGTFVEVAHELGLDHDDREDYSDDQSYRCYCADKKTCDPMPPTPKWVCDIGYGPYFRGWYPGISDQPWSLGGNNMGVTCADADDDGDMDVVFANITHLDVGGASDPTELIVNPGQGGKFTRPGNDVTGLTRTPLTSIIDYYDHQAAFVDFDQDGRKDLLVLDNHANDKDHAWLWRQDATGHFTEISATAGLPKTVDLGVGLVDVDGDGDLDLMTSVTPDQGLRVFRNRVGQEQNAVRVKLVGKGKGFSSVSAIGARVRVTAGGRTQTQEVKGGQGLGNIQPDFTLTFGLGTACDVEEIEVRWPDGQGTITKYQGVAANYLVVLREGVANPEYAN